MRCRAAPRSHVEGGSSTSSTDTTLRRLKCTVQYGPFSNADLQRRTILGYGHITMVKHYALLRAPLRVLSSFVLVQTANPA
jgi:hypothetical protein